MVLGGFLWMVSITENGWLTWIFFTAFTILLLFTLVLYSLLNSILESKVATKIMTVVMTHNLIDRNNWMVNNISVQGFFDLLYREFISPTARHHWLTSLRFLWTLAWDRLYVRFGWVGSLQKHTESLSRARWTQGLKCALILKDACLKLCIINGKGWLTHFYKSFVILLK